MRSPKKRVEMQQSQTCEKQLVTFLEEYGSYLSEDLAKITWESHDLMMLQIYASNNNPFLEMQYF